jgi:Fe-S cluster assembly scaffold protein SufB
VATPQTRVSDTPVLTENEQLARINSDYAERYGFHDAENYLYKAPKGLTREIVEKISEFKSEPQWMRDFRLKALDHFLARPQPTWGSPLLAEVDYDDIHYFVRASEKPGRSWDDVPEDVKRTFDRLGIPEAERKFLSGVGAQYECLAEETLVYTARGHVPIKDVEAGDTVFSFDESANRLMPAQVRATAPKGRRPVYRVEVGNRVVRATENHPFLCLEYDEAPGRVRGRYRRRWKYLRDLQEGDLVAVSKKLPDVGESAQVRELIGAVANNERDRPITSRHRLFIGGDASHLPFRNPRRSERVGRHRYSHAGSSAKGTTFRSHVNEEFGYVRIGSIVPDGEAEVYDIEVDGPHNFVAEGLIVHNSEVVYHQVREDLEQQGVIFMDMDSGLREHEDIVRKYWATVIPPNDNKLAALNSAVWSGGSFVYVPEGVHVEMPLQAYFRINTENMGQFERTLIIAEPGSYVHYVEGCALAGSMVRVRDGEKPIEEIEAGDEVLTHRGCFRRVKEPMRRRFSGPIHHIKFQGEGDRSLAVTPGHPFLVSRRRRDREHNRAFEQQWLTAQELRKGDYLALPAKIDTETAPQLLVETDVSVGAGRHTAVLEKVGVAVEATHAQAVLADGYLWMPISSIEKIHAECDVYNMSVEEDESYVMEGVVSHNCTAPNYSSNSLHSAVVELIAQPGARIRYTTVQNWSTNVFNLVTKRAVAYEDATVEWVDCNLGSRLTSKYPSVYLLGERAHGEILSIAFAGHGQHQDAGGKIIHGAPNTTSNIFAKSISKDGGRSSYRGLLEVAKGAHGAKSKVVCDALLLDEKSRSDTYPTIRIGEDDVDVGHEATVSKVGEDQLFYLMSHGIPEEEASKLIVNGFIEPIVKELPMEYAVEMNKLIELQMEGSIG